MGKDRRAAEEEQRAGGGVYRDGHGVTGMVEPGHGGL